MLPSLIKQFMIRSIELKVIVCSWGISDIKISNNRLEFNVSGFNYKGHITLYEQNNILCLELSDEIHVVFKTVDEAITYLDAKIEYDHKYFFNVIKLLRSIE